MSDVRIGVTLRAVAPLASTTVGGRDDNVAPSLPHTPSADTDGPQLVAVAAGAGTPPLATAAIPSAAAKSSSLDVPSTQSAPVDDGAPGMRVGLGTLALVAVTCSVLGLLGGRLLARARS